jgi:myosin-5
MISLLDIFGFERFQVNRFEQLCINFANEQLQHKYVLDNFRKVQEEYEAEGIEIFDFAVVDNSPVLDLLQGRLGLIMSLNEECVRPNGNDESYVYKIKTLHKDHGRLIDKKLHRRTEFGVKHFAGPVTYDSTKFVERNTDKLPDGLMYCAARSTNALIREEFETLVKTHEDNESSGVRRKKATNRTVLEKFRSQLRDLMASMEDTETRYIRCIKPNETMTPRVTQHDTTMRQLECAGLVTAIAISRESFPNRLGYEPIMERFECLMSDADAKKMSTMVTKLAVDYMLRQLLATMAEKQRNGTLAMPFQCGNTRVYFRAGALEHLETKRLAYYTKRVVTIQRCVRKIQGQAAYTLMRESIIKAQAVVRAMLAYKRLQRQKSAAVKLQCWVRMLQAASLLISLKSNHAATVIQSTWRSTSRLGQMHKYRKAAVVIQKAVRNRKKKTNFTAKLARTVEMARMDHRVKGLQRKVSARGNFLPQSTTGRKVDESLLQEIET